MYVCVCVCVCERERERKRERPGIDVIGFKHDKQFDNEGLSSDSRGMLCGIKYMNFLYLPISFPRFLASYVLFS